MSKVIKTKFDYENALAEIEALIDLDPDVGTREGDRLELLVLLVEEYEAKKFQFELPDPVEAIKFRMEQQDLSPRDLVPYLGSRSKVSEILSGKRSLTLSMIRALNSGLGIPAKVLIQETNAAGNENIEIEWDRFPIKEMISRGWIKGDLSNIQSQAEKILRQFFTPLDSPVIKAVLYRKTSHIRSARSMDEYALAAWSAQVMRKALDNPPSTKYKSGTVKLDLMRQIAKLSISNEGPLLAYDFLREIGIALIIEPHLPRTHLDGAAILIKLDMPVIGLTLRHDRIDNFWFSLMHELAHLSLHFDEDENYFYDDLDVDLEVESQDDSREQEADELAGEALIPEEEWKRSPASRLRSPEAAEHLAKKLQIHPAIVAGRMRYEFKAYRLLNNLVGHREVRKLFPEVNWSGQNSE